MMPPSAQRPASAQSGEWPGIPFGRAARRATLPIGIPDYSLAKTLGRGCPRAGCPDPTLIIEDSGRNSMLALNVTISTTDPITCGVDALVVNVFEGEKISGGDLA